jgi:myo-inositol catabolism protein IolC
MPRGFDRPLYVLSLDHRGSPETGALAREHSAQIAAEKQVIYDGFKAAIAAGLPKQNTAILMDDQFAATILRDANSDGLAIICPVEKSRQHEFDFEHGEDFPIHLEAFQPTFCKARVRYNPEGNQALNRRQTDRLKRLSHYLHSASRTLLMLELIVPAEKSQLDKVNGNKRTYDLELRPRLMVQAIEELQDAHVEPDVWMVEGLDRREDCERIVAAARYGGRDKVGCIVLDRGDDHGISGETNHIREWLKIASTVPGFIGFAIGPTAFSEPIASWRAKSATRKSTVSQIAKQYSELVDIFEKTRTQ